MVNATHLGALNAEVSDYSDPARRLTLECPDGRVLEDEVKVGDEVVTGFYGQPMPARLVVGEWSGAISQHVGKGLRLVEAGEEGAVDRGPIGAVSLISTGSLGRLADQAGRSTVDSRRFR